MKIQVKNKNNELIHETENVEEAYDFLSGEVPAKRLGTLEQLQENINDDINNNRSSQQYEFQKSSDANDKVSMKIDYELPVDEKVEKYKEIMHPLFDDNYLKGLVIGKKAYSSVLMKKINEGLNGLSTIEDYKRLIVDIYQYCEMTQKPTVQEAMELEKQVADRRKNKK